MRDTKHKRHIQQILKNTTTPVSVPDIIQALTVLNISANKTTIYRELESLMQQGLLLELNFGEGKKRYEFKKDSHHHHLICKKCKYVEHIELDELESVLGTTEEKISKQNSFKVTDHSLELFGLCGGCR